MFGQKAGMSRAKGVGNRGLDTGNMECGVDSTCGGRKFQADSSGANNSGNGEGVNKFGG